MTDPPPEEEPPDGESPWRRFRRHGLSVVAVGGAVANVIQIVTTGRPTTQGLVIVAGTLAAGLVPLAFQIRRSRQQIGYAGGLSMEQVECLERLDMLGDQVEYYEQQLQNIRSALEAAFSTAPPYSDEMTVIFDIGDRPGGDHVEEIHRTSAHPGMVVHWYAFEAFGGGRDQALQWHDMEPKVTREREVGDERVIPVELTSAISPRALITFSPPHRMVKWEARYRSPGYWNGLRERGQSFEWVPPLAGLGENGGRRSSVRVANFVFRVPVSMGTLEALKMPPGIALRPVAADAHGRTYRVDIDDPSVFLGAPGAAVDPIAWYLVLRSEGAP